MKKLKLFYHWLNYVLSGWTHPHKHNYQLELYFDYLNEKHDI